MNNNFVFTGVISQLGDVTTIKTKHGLQNKRDIVLTTAGAYPQSLLLELVGEKATGFPGMVGQTVTAYLTFKVGTSPTTGRMWNNIHCWRIDIVSSSNI